MTSPYEETPKARWFGKDVTSVLVTHTNQRVSIEVDDDTHRYTMDFETTGEEIVKTYDTGEPL